jgi:hypothetical protein
MKNLPVIFGYAYIGNHEFCSLAEAAAYLDHINNQNDTSGWVLHLLKIVESRDDFNEASFAAACEKVGIGPEINTEGLTSEEIASLLLATAATALSCEEATNKGLLLLEQKNISWKGLLAICKKVDSTPVWEKAIKLPAFRQKFPLENESTVFF